METKQRVQQIVLRVIDRINAALPEDQQIEKSPSAVLVGPDGFLDSLNLLELAISIQKSVLDEFGVACAVMNEDALARAESPFHTVGNLVEYVTELVGNMQPS